MKALITGASSGIGKEMAIYLGELGYDLVVVARNKTKLDNLKKISKLILMYMNMIYRLKITAINYIII